MLNRSVRDFVALFNALWYRDFPIIAGHERLSSRAMWTTHIASVVKQTADFMGFFTCFETGGRTDAIIQTAARAHWAKIEWEWIQPRHEGVNEISKLAASIGDAEHSIFIGYSREVDHEENLRRIGQIWADVDKPLLVFLITWDGPKSMRRFQQLQTYLFENNRSKVLRTQPALPWQVKNTKWWAMQASPAESQKARPAN